MGSLEDCFYCLVGSMGIQPVKSSCPHDIIFCLGHQVKNGLTALATVT